MKKLSGMLLLIIGWVFLSQGSLYAGDWQGLVHDKYSRTEGHLRLCPREIEGTGRFVGKKSGFYRLPGRILIYNTTEEVILAGVFGRIAPGGARVESLRNQTSLVTFEGIESGKVYGQASLGPTSQGTTVIVRESGIEYRGVD
ncbi:MAG: hypothetical protein GF333_03880 [Candidatus Omnitrophica bacterium]|nr:hypothetical protein [Candidatus Omnitrophota bacterium]